MGEGNTNKLIKAGFTDITSILKMTKNDFMKLDGFKEKMATKVHGSIVEIIKNISLVELMAATNIFGRSMGRRRISDILSAYPDILTSKISDEKKIEMIASLDGFGNKTAKLFVPHINEFLEFVIKSNLQYKIVDFIKESYNKDENL